MLDPALHDAVLSRGGGGSWRRGAAYYEEIDRVKKSGVFAEIHTKHQKNLEAMLAALPEEEREVARQRLTAEARNNKRL